MYTVKLFFGLQNISRQVAPGTTVGQLLQDEVVRAQLHIGDNVIAKIDGRVVPNDRQVCQGQQIVIETRANEKA